ncbi:MAG: ACP S-malonyltransferase [Lachnospiraceae bacterium]|nr:ACP S-malonyltransferase [Lachnospiraceae bacterium]
MSKIAFVFPGQGAQYVGMGKDFYENFQTAKDIFAEAEQASGLDVAAICFEENEKINQTEYTQIAMLATELAIAKVLEDEGISPQVTAGLSLGEYGAVVTAGVMSTKDAFKVVRQRGILMQNAVPVGGAMAAVLGSSQETIEKICDETEGIVSIANYNCPGQIVITGEEAAVDKACEALKEAGAKRCVKLNVSGPFHSALLETAGQELSKVLAPLELEEMTIPYLTNVTGDYVAAVDEIKELLEKQVSSSVRWQQNVERMIADGVDVMIEIGPGKTLSGFLRKIDKEKKVTMYNVENIEDLNKLLENRRSLC